MLCGNFLTCLAEENYCLGAAAADGPIVPTLDDI